MHKIFFSLFVLLLGGCSQAIVTRAGKNLTITHNKIQHIVKKDEIKILAIKTGLGDTKIDYFDQSKFLQTKIIERTELNWPVILTSIVSSAVLIPVLAVVGLEKANPSWQKIAGFSNDKEGEKEKNSFIKGDISSFTIPYIFIGALIGSLPLLNLFYSEKANSYKLWELN